MAAVLPFPLFSRLRRGCLVIGPILSVRPLAPCAEKTRFPFEGVQAERGFAGCDLHRLVAAETVAMEQDGGWWGLQVRCCYDAPSTIKALIDVLCRSHSETFLTSHKEQEGAANVTLKSDTDVWGGGPRRALRWLPGLRGR